MRFFHLADLHLGKQMYHYNLREDQKHILKEVLDYARERKPQAVLLSGDIYDKSVPSAEAVSMLDWFLTELSDLEPKISIIMISGNHDSGERLDYASTLLGKQQIHIGGRPPVREEDYLRKVILEDDHGQVNFYLLPFLKPSYMRNLFPEEENLTYTRAVELLLHREEIDYGKRNVLLSHQFYTGNGQTPDICDSETITVGGLDNVDVLTVENFDYVALGHIHRPQQVGYPHIRYGGTLLKYSVSEENHDKGLAMVTLDEKGVAPIVEMLPLHPLRDVRKITGTLEEVLRTGREGASQDYVSVTLTDEEELFRPRQQLDTVYSHLLEVHMDNSRVRQKLSHVTEQIEIKNPLEMYKDFYREIHGSDLSLDGTEAVRELMEELEEESL